ncbi:uncharacterized protein LOC109924803 isoform X1 [Rhincodon typus]|uniref:uncharacterized protein LOC109924803 isoform X1 n=1 Tax=Rhincodon typus TaxID=259920 RepID=UPI00202FBD24|nr:uncharacterized protein LOC109924803 isoform X1 [Rhincodon typus]
MSIRSLTNFYRCTIESILPGCIWPDMATALPRTERNCRRWCAQPRPSQKPTFHPWTPLTRLTAMERQPTSSKTHRTPVMTSYNLFHQAEGTEACTHAPAGSGTASFCRYQTDEWTLASNNVTYISKNPGYLEKTIKDTNFGGWPLSEDVTISEPESWRVLVGLGGESRSRRSISDDVLQALRSTDRKGRDVVAGLSSACCKWGCTKSEISSLC